EAHRKYLDVAPTELGIKILLSGPLTDDSGQMMIGSFFMLDAEERDQVDRMFRDDPLAHAGVWKELSVARVYVRQNNIGSLGDDP
ncbi:MAG: YciI family protein, partial [Pseudomonadota bacterium]